MLILTRKQNEVICIGHNITITVAEIRGDRVRLAISAPRDVQVHRSEIWVAIQRAEANKPHPATESLSGPQDAQ